MKVVLLILMLFVGGNVLSTPKFEVKGGVTTIYLNDVLSGVTLIANNRVFQFHQTLFVENLTNLEVTY